MPFNREQPAIAPRLLDKLPKSFAPLLNEQLQNWPQLFPAEQRPIASTLEYLEDLPEERLAGLLAPILDLEKKMKLPRWTPASDRLSIEETSMLARSPFYSKWRVAVGRFYDRVSAAIEAEGAVRGKPHRLLILTLPPGLPIGNRSLFSKMARKGGWVQLEKPFGKLEGALLERLVQRPAPAGIEAIEHTWLFDAAPRPVGTGGTTLTEMSWQRLEKARLYFRRKLNEIDKDLRSADHTYKELLRADLSRMTPGPAGKDLRLREFIRQLFLSGNGAVLFNNSFVQWGASEALRRAQPQVMVCRFGIRQRIKPFSSLVLFEDQNKANPVEDSLDPEGSLIDAELLARYVHLSAQRQGAYRERTISLFTAAESNVALWVAPKGAPQPSLAAPLSGDHLSDTLTDWLAASPAA